MFNNVGQSLKKLAVSMFVVGLIVSLIVGIGLIMTFSAFTFLGLLLIPVGTFFAWVGALFIYGFGELICNTKEIALNTAKPQTAQNSKANAVKAVPAEGKNDAKKAAPVAVKNNAVQVNKNENMNSSTYADCQGLKFKSNHDGTCSVSGIGSCTDSHVAIPSCSPQGKPVTDIGENAFSECDTLKSVTIPSSVTSINPYAFYSCKNLTSITIPSNVTFIGTNAFLYCANLTIKCEAPSKPDGWESDWAPANIPVVWGYKA